MMKIRDAGNLPEIALAALGLLTRVAAVAVLAAVSACATAPGPLGSAELKAGLPSCAALKETCAAGGSCGQCMIRVCVNHTCGVGCAENVYDLKPMQDCWGRDCRTIINGHQVSGGDPYWFNQVDARRWHDCTGKAATAPICYNDFLALGQKVDSVNCSTLEGVRACCGDEYLAAVCPGKPALACECHSCGRPK